jgi:dolichol kinase
MWILQEGPEMFILPYIMNSKFTIQLILFWILLVIIAILIVGQKSGTNSKATTSERKIFHGLIVAVIISGVIVDIEFTYFASLIALAIFLYLEYIRAFDIRPLSRLLDESFMRFTDEKDQGTLVLTNIYLLVGTFLPLWITYDLSSANKLVILSGALSVGIGDSAASIVGSCYGYYRWPYSPKKSVDGTLASVVSQVLLLLILSFANVIHHSYVSRAFLPVVITSLIEAHTTQVDNLVLPLTMYILFSAQDLFYPVHL